MCTSKLIKGLKDCESEILTTDLRLSQAIVAKDYEKALEITHELSSMLVAHLCVSAILEDEAV